MTSTQGAKMLREITVTQAQEPFRLMTQTAAKDTTRARNSSTRAWLSVGLVRKNEGMSSP